MKNIFLVALTIFGVSAGFSQEHCGFDEHNRKLMLQFPGAEQQMHEQIMRIKEQQIGQDRASVYTIPVVFHVIHDGGPSNISYDQIQSSIDMLNEDFNHLNADTINIRNTTDAPFEPVSADISILFELAKLDPNNQCTNGVQRHYSTTATENAYEDVKSSATGGVDGWPRNNYLNIWVVSSIDYDGGSGGTTLGYAQFPYFGAANTYGVVIRHDRVGDIGTALAGDRTLTHEIGHCMGLFHTFQGGCSNQDCADNGDYCCDTPPVLEAQWSCVTTQNTCGAIPVGSPYGIDAFDQFENFMSYSPCQYMFSEDQKSIVLANIAANGWMTTLTSSGNATNAGVGLPDILCKAEFSSTETLICAGSSIDYSDNSYSNVSGRTWSFPGGTPSSSTAQNPTIVYNTAGVYEVTLSVTDGTTNVMTTETDYVRVLANPGVNPPIHEGFEGFTAITDNYEFFVEDGDAAGSWEIVTGLGSSGNQCIKLDNFGVVNNSFDNLMSSTIDLSGVDAADQLIFNFKYAYKKRTSGNDEWLRVYVSKDCGENWILRKSVHGSALGPDQIANPFTPVDEDWRQINITNVGSPYYVSNFRYMIEFENDLGNNIYIDDINIYPAAMTSIDESALVQNISVYPNPVNSEMDIKFNTVLEGDYNIVLTDALGKQISIVYSGYLSEGPNQINYNAAHLPVGVYFLNIEMDGIKTTTKVMKN